MIRYASIILVSTVLVSAAYAENPKLVQIVGQQVPLDVQVMPDAPVNVNIDPNTVLTTEAKFSPPSAVSAFDLLVTSEETQVLVDRDSVLKYINFAVEDGAWYGTLGLPCYWRMEASFPPPFDRNRVPLARFSFMHSYQPEASSYTTFKNLQTVSPPFAQLAVGDLLLPEGTALVATGNCLGELGESGQHVLVRVYGLLFEP